MIKRLTTKNNFVSIVLDARRKFVGDIDGRESLMEYGKGHKYL